MPKTTPAPAPAPAPAPFVPPAQGGSYEIVDGQPVLQERTQLPGDDAQATAP